MIGENPNEGYRAGERLKFLTLSGEIVDSVELVSVSIEREDRVATYGNLRPGTAAKLLRIRHQDADY